MARPKTGGNQRDQDGRVVWRQRRGAFAEGQGGRVIAQRGGKLRGRSGDHGVVWMLSAEIGDQREGFVNAAGVLQHLALDHVELRVARRRAQCGFDVSQCGARVAGAHPAQLREFVVRSVEVGAALQRFVEGALGLVELRKRLQRARAHEPAFRQIDAFGEGAADVLLGFAPAAGVAQRGGEVVLRGRALRRERDDLAAGGDRFVEPARGLERRRLRGEFLGIE